MDAAIAPEAGLAQLWRMKLGTGMHANAKRALSFGRFLLSLALWPHLAVCVITALAMLPLLLAVRSANTLLAVSLIVCSGCAWVAGRIFRRLRNEFAEDVRFVVRESNELSARVVPLITRRWPKLWPPLVAANPAVAVEAGEGLSWPLSCAC